MIPYIDTNWYPWLEKSEKRSVEGKGGWKRDKTDIMAALHLLQRVFLRLKQSGRLERRDFDFSPGPYSHDICMLKEFLVAVISPPFHIGL